MNLQKQSEVTPDGISSQVKSEIDIEKDSKESKIQETDEGIMAKFNPRYSYMVLAIVTMISIATQWQQKSIGYFYGFSGIGDM